MIRSIKQILMPIFILLTLTSAGAQAQQLPNVVFIFTDDLGWGDVWPGIDHYTLDQEYITEFNTPTNPAPQRPESPLEMETSNIKALALQSMRFTDAHSASAVCAPSRYSALTGNYPARGRDRRGTWRFNQNVQTEGQNTVADVMKEAGYNTGFIGKWHLGGDFYENDGTNDGSAPFYRDRVDWSGRANMDDAQLQVLHSNLENHLDSINFGLAFKNGPLDHGFNYSFTLPGGIQSEPFAYFENDDYIELPYDQTVNQAPLDPSYRNTPQTGLYVTTDLFPNSVDIAAGMDDEFPNRTYDNRGGIYDVNWNSKKVGSNLAAKAVEFIDNHVLQNGTTNPFFLYYATQAPHGPYTPPDYFEGYAGTTKAVKGVSTIGDRGDMIVELDHQVSEIMDALTRNGVENNTLIIFTSDNGGYNGPNFDNERIKGHYSVADLRGRKGQVYEGGHRVPFFVKWPGKITPGKNSILISVNDWVASMYSLTETPIPYDQAMDSANILPWILGEKSSTEQARPYLVVDASPSNNGNEELDGDSTQCIHNPDPTPQDPNTIDGDICHQGWKTIRAGNWALFLDESSETFTGSGSYNVPDFSNSPQDLYNMGNDRIQDTNLINTSYIGKQNELDDLYKEVETLYENNKRTVPRDPCGDPQINLNLDRVVALWQDCAGDNSWHLVVTGGNGTGLTYAGNLSTNQLFTNVEPQGVESTDTLVSTDLSIDFSLTTGGAWSDGFDFEVADGNTCLTLNQPVGTQVIVGENRTPVTSPFDIHTLESCSTSPPSGQACGDPAFDAPQEEEPIIVLWQDCAGDGSWHLRVSAGGAQQPSAPVVTFTGNLMTDQPSISNVVPKSIESSDSLVDTPTSINFSLTMGSIWYDGFDFEINGSDDTCLTLSAPTVSHQVLVGENRTPVTPSFNIHTLESCP